MQSMTDTMAAELLGQLQKLVLFVVGAKILGKLHKIYFSPHLHRVAKWRTMNESLMSTYSRVSQL